MPFLCLVKETLIEQYDWVMGVSLFLFCVPFLCLVKETTMEQCYWYIATHTDAPQLIIKGSLKKAGTRRDGRTARQLTARFRRRLKDNITAALAWGFGLMLISAGGVNPRGGRDDLAW